MNQKLQETCHSILSHGMFHCCGGWITAHSSGDRCPNRCPIFSQQASKSHHGTHRSWNINNSDASLSKHFPFPLFEMLISFLKLFLFDRSMQFCSFPCQRQAGRTGWTPYMLQRIGLLKQNKTNKKNYVQCSQSLQPSLLSFLKLYLFDKIHIHLLCK